MRHKEWKFPLVRTPDYLKDAMQAAVKSLSGKYHTMGAEVEHFEREFAVYHGRKYAVMVNSGSSANLIAVAAVRYSSENIHGKPGVAVVPAIGWGTTYHPFYQLGYQMRLIDVEPTTFNMDVRSLLNYLGMREDRLDIIMAVSVLGNPANLKALRELADGCGAILIEDNCESIGAMLDGRLTGTFGHMSTFSFYYSHQLSTIEGGMVLTDDLLLYKRLRLLRDHGVERGEDGSYMFHLPGFNVRPTEAAAAMGRVGLRNLLDENVRRREIWEIFQRKMAGSEYAIQQELPGAMALPFGLCLVAQDETAWNHLVHRLDGYEIEHRMITGGCISCHPVWDWYARSGSVTVGAPVNAQAIHKYGVFVGVGSRGDLLNLFAALGVS